MTIHWKTSLFALACTSLAAIAVPAAAQWSAQQVQIRGHIEQEGNHLPGDGLMVELHDPNTHRILPREAVSPGGDFTLPSVDYGSYELRITDLYGNEIKREFVYVSEQSSDLTVRLPAREAARPASGTVSVARLQIPKKAVREVQRAEDDARRGDIAKSIRRLEKAIHIAPRFAEAYNNLGSRYLKLGDMAKAEELYRTAAELDPAFALPRANLSIVCLGARRFPEAEAEARKALEIDPQSLPATYALGLALEQQGKAPAEALASLRRASTAFPDARFAAARTLARAGDIRGAESELETYTHTPGASRRQDAEKWLKALRRNR